jgi:hypothetical protein
MLKIRPYKVTAVMLCNHTTRLAGLAKLYNWLLQSVLGGEADPCFLIPKKHNL